MIELLNRTEAADYSELYSLRKELDDLMEELRDFLKRKNRTAGPQPTAISHPNR